MPKVSFQQDANRSEDSAKAPSIVAQKIREAILDEVYKPGDRFGEVELAERGLTIAPL
jgi:DNA-binding GntR family transcriptional regulator